MREDVILIVATAAAAGILVICLGVGILAPQFIYDHQRYSTYLEAQRTVLQCRADHSIAAIDRVCGPIPTLESIK